MTNKPMTHQGTFTLETERLILRRYVPEDAEAMFRNWVNDPEVTRYLTWQPHGSIELTRKILMFDISKYEGLSHYQWAVVLKSSNEPIGGVNVVRVDETCNCCEVAYRLGKAWWRQGFASEALTAVISFLFEQVGANSISARYDTRNPGSGAVMRKCGMSYEGTLRQSGCNNQGIYDAACYAILAEDYFTKAGRKNANPVPLGVYRHYKGNRYEVVGFAKHSETLEDMIIYKALYGERGTWVRPLSMWSNLIEVDGKTVKRFEFIAEEKESAELMLRKRPKGAENES